MSNLKVGTLVMLKPGYSHTGFPQSGYIGTVMDTSGKNELWSVRADHVAVEFPTLSSPHVTGWWQYPVTSLIVLGGPDIELGEEDKAPVKQGKPVEETT